MPTFATTRASAFETNTWLSAVNGADYTANLYTSTRGNLDIAFSGADMDASIYTISAYADLTIKQCAGRW